MISFHAYYVANAGFAALALLWLHYSNLSYGPAHRPLGWLAQVLVASFGSLLILRSAVVVLAGDDGKPIQAGPAGAVTALLGFIDQVINRNQAEARSAAIGRIMIGIDFDAAVVNLPPICLRLMSRTSERAVESLTLKVEKLMQEKGDPRAKVISLGALMIEFCGEDVLEGAISAAEGVLRLDANAPPIPTLTAGDLLAAIDEAEPADGAS
jgi:hypothetical protein